MLLGMFGDVINYHWYILSWYHMWLLLDHNKLDLNKLDLIRIYLDVFINWPILACTRFDPLTILPIVVTFDITSQVLQVLV